MTWWLGALIGIAVVSWAVWVWVLFVSEALVLYRERKEQIWIGPKKWL